MAMEKKEKRKKWRKLRGKRKGIENGFLTTSKSMNYMAKSKT